MVIIINF